MAFGRGGRRSARRALSAALLVLAPAALAATPAAAGAARALYVADAAATGSGTLAQFSLTVPAGAPRALAPPAVASGGEPQHVAVSADGRFAYATATEPGLLFAYRVRRADGALLPLPSGPVGAGIGAHGVAVSPDDRFLYVANQEPGSVSQYRLGGGGAPRPLGVPNVPSGEGASGVAIAPDGRSVYVTNLRGASVSQFDADPRTGALRPKSPPTVPTPAAPSGLGVSPDGRSLYVATLSGRLAQFDLEPDSGAMRPKRRAVVPVGLGAAGVAITPDGRFLYTPNGVADTVSQFSIAPRGGALSALSPAAVAAGERPEGVAVAPNGRSLYAGSAGIDSVAWLTIRGDGRLAGGRRAPLATGPGPHGLAVTPNQGPVARLRIAAPGPTVRVGEPLRLDASGSADSDGTVARFHWRFGDGARRAGRLPRIAHRYAEPGSYTVRLRVVDDERCSARFLYTGQSASCNGGPAALAAVRVTVLPVGGSAAASRAGDGGRRAGALGSLVQLRGARGCLVGGSRNPARCGTARALEGPGPFLGSRAIAVSPDGRNVYVAASRSDAIAVFSRDRRSGALTQPGGSAGCVAAGAADGCGRAIGLDGPNSVAVSPDGRFVYASARGSNAVTSFRRDRRSGALRQLPGPAGCVSGLPLPGCATGRALLGPDVVAVSPDGENLYAGSFFGNSVAIFARARNGVLFQAADSGGCIAEAIAGCAPAIALGAPEGLAISPDGSSVYVASALSNAVAELVRDPATGALSQPGGGSGCIASPALAGCAEGVQLGGANAVAIAPAGRDVYVASLLSNGVASFSRSAAGLLTPKPATHACLVYLRSAGCSFGRAMLAPEGLALSPDGRNVYVAAFRSGAIDVLRRDRESGIVFQVPGAAGCVAARSLPGCTPGRALRGVSSIAVSPDGRHVYATAFASNAVDVFRRNR